MSISYAQIIKASRTILETVGYHTTEARRERRFITAYQVWKDLKRENHPICKELIEECGGDFVGEGAGSNVGPAQKIAQALGNSAKIETQYLDTRCITFSNIKPSGEDCGLFRLRS